MFRSCSKMSMVDADRQRGQRVSSPLEPQASFSRKNCEGSLQESGTKVTTTLVRTSEENMFRRSQASPQWAECHRQRSRKVFGQVSTKNSVQNEIARKSFSDVFPPQPSRPLKRTLDKNPDVCVRYGVNQQGVSTGSHQYTHCNMTTECSKIINQPLQSMWQSKNELAKYSSESLWCRPSAAQSLSGMTTTFSGTVSFESTRSACSSGSTAASSSLKSSSRSWSTNELPSGSSYSLDLASFGVSSPTLLPKEHDSSAASKPLAELSSLPPSTVYLAAASEASSSSIPASTALSRISSGSKALEGIISPARMERTASVATRAASRTYTLTAVPPPSTALSGSSFSAGSDPDSATSSRKQISCSLPVTDYSAPVGLVCRLLMRRYAAAAAAVTADRPAAAAKAEKSNLFFRKGRQGRSCGESYQQFFDECGWIWQEEQERGLLLLRLQRKQLDREEVASACCEAFEREYELPERREAPVGASLNSIFPDVHRPLQDGALPSITENIRQHFAVALPSVAMKSPSHHLRESCSFAKRANAPYTQISPSPAQQDHGNMPLVGCSSAASRATERRAALTSTAVDHFSPKRAAAASVATSHDDAFVIRRMSSNGSLDSPIQEGNPIAAGAVCWETEDEGTPLGGGLRSGSVENGDKLKLRECFDEQSERRFDGRRNNSNTTTTANGSFWVAGTGLVGEWAAKAAAHLLDCTDGGVSQGCSSRKLHMRGERVEVTEKGTSWMLTAASRCRLVRRSSCEGRLEGWRAEQLSVRVILRTREKPAPASSIQQNSLSAFRSPTRKKVTFSMNCTSLEREKLALRVPCRLSSVVEETARREPLISCVHHSTYHYPGSLLSRYRANCHQFTKAAETAVQCGEDAAALLGAAAAAAVSEAVETKTEKRRGAAVDKQKEADAEEGDAAATGLLQQVNQGLSTTKISQAKVLQQESLYPVKAAAHIGGTVLREESYYIFNKSRQSTGAARASRRGRTVVSRRCTPCVYPAMSVLMELFDSVEERSGAFYGDDRPQREEQKKKNKKKDSSQLKNGTGAAPLLKSASALPLLHEQQHVLQQHQRPHTQQRQQQLLAQHHRPRQQPVPPRQFRYQRQATADERPQRQRQPQQQRVTAQQQRLWELQHQSQPLKRREQRQQRGENLTITSGREASFPRQSLGGLQNVEGDRSSSRGGGHLSDLSSYRTSSSPSIPLLCPRYYHPLERPETLFPQARARQLRRLLMVQSTCVISSGDPLLLATRLPLLQGSAAAVAALAEGNMAAYNQLSPASVAARTLTIAAAARRPVLLPRSSTLLLQQQHPQRGGVFPSSPYALPDPIAAADSFDYAPGGLGSCAGVTSAFSYNRNRSCSTTTALQMETRWPLGLQHSSGNSRHFRPRGWAYLRSASEGEAQEEEDEIEHEDEDEEDEEDEYNEYEEERARRRLRLRFLRRRNSGGNGRGGGGQDGEERSVLSRLWLQGRSNEANVRSDEGRTGVKGKLKRLLTPLFFSSFTAAFTRGERGDRERRPMNSTENMEPLADEDMWFTESEASTPSSLSSRAAAALQHNFQRTSQPAAASAPDVSRRRVKTARTVWRKCGSGRRYKVRGRKSQPPAKVEQGVALRGGEGFCQGSKEMPAIQEGSGTAAAMYKSQAEDAGEQKFAKEKALGGVDYIMERDEFGGVALALSERQEQGKKVDEYTYAEVPPPARTLETEDCEREDQSPAQQEGIAYTKKKQEQQQQQQRGGGHLLEQQTKSKMMEAEKKAAQEPPQQRSPQPQEPREQLLVKRVEESLEKQAGPQQIATSLGTETLRADCKFSQHEGQLLWRDEQQQKRELRQTPQLERLQPHSQAGRVMNTQQLTVRTGMLHTLSEEQRASLGGRGFHKTNCDKRVQQQSKHGGEEAGFSNTVETGEVQEQQEQPHGKEAALSGVETTESYDTDTQLLAQPLTAGSQLSRFSIEDAEEKSGVGSATPSAYQQQKPQQQLLIQLPVKAQPYCEPSSVEQPDEVAAMQGLSAAEDRNSRGCSTLQAAVEEDMVAVKARLLTFSSLVHDTGIVSGGTKGEKNLLGGGCAAGKAEEGDAGPDYPDVADKSTYTGGESSCAWYVEEKKNGGGVLRSCSGGNNGSLVLALSPAALSASANDEVASPSNGSSTASTPLLVQRWTSGAVLVDRTSTKGTDHESRRSQGSRGLRWRWGRPGRKKGGDSQNVRKEEDPTVPAAFKEYRCAAASQFLPAASVPAAQSPLAAKEAGSTTAFGWIEYNDEQITSSTAAGSQQTVTSPFHSRRTLSKKSSLLLSFDPLPAPINTPTVCEKIEKTQHVPTLLHRLSFHFRRRRESEATSPSKTGACS